MYHLVSREWGYNFSMRGSHAEVAQEDVSRQNGLLATPKGAVHLLGGVTTGTAEVVASKLGRESINGRVVVDACRSPVFCPCQDS